MVLFVFVYRPALFFVSLNQKFSNLDFNAVDTKYGVFVHNQRLAQATYQLFWINKMPVWHTRRKCVDKPDDE